MKLLFERESKNAVRVEEIVSGAVTTTYVGNATSGSLDDQEVWQIQKIVETVVGGTTTTTITFPNGDNRYGFIWDNRSSYVYL